MSTVALMSDDVIEQIGEILGCDVDLYTEFTLTLKKNEAIRYTITATVSAEELKSDGPDVPVPAGPLGNVEAEED